MLAAWGLHSVLTTTEDAEALALTQRAQQQGTLFASLPGDHTREGAGAGAGTATGAGIGSGTGGAVTDPSEQEYPLSEAALQSVHRAMALPLTLDEAEFAVLGRKHGTDKLTQHGYHRFYPRFLEHFRALRGVGMVEIGMLQGYSLLLWLEYFPHAFVYGVDNNNIVEVDKDLRQGQGQGQEGVQGDRFFITNADQGDRQQMARFLQQIRHPLFLVLDDGSHIPAHQVLSFNPLLFNVFLS
jgi:hypothetical protein